MAAFESDISRYSDLAEEIIAENAGEAIRFLYVDCGPLKQVRTDDGHTPGKPLVICHAQH